jgi:hypothetical protein
VKNRSKVSSRVISENSIAVPNLGRRSVSDHWILVKFPKVGGPSDLIVNKKNAQKKRTDLRCQI